MAAVHWNGQLDFHGGGFTAFFFSGLLEGVVTVIGMCERIEIETSSRLGLIDCSEGMAGISSTSLLQSVVLATDMWTSGAALRPRRETIHIRGL